jgi:hypothetical protein
VVRARVATVTREIGPEFDESGDPEWIRADVRAGGAFSGIDRYVAQ